MIPTRNRQAEQHSGNSSQHHLPLPPPRDKPPHKNSSVNNVGHSVNDNDIANRAHATPPNAPLHPLRHLATSRQRRRARDPTPIARSTRAVLRRHALPRVPRRTLRNRLRRRVRRSRQQPKVKYQNQTTTTLSFVFFWFLPWSAFIFFFYYFVVWCVFFLGGAHFRDFVDGWDDDCYHRRDAASVIAAIAVANGSARLSALKESPFLPSVSGESRRIF